MAAFLREMILILTAVTLMEHLMPTGPMERAGRFVLGLVLLMTVAGSLKLPEIPAMQPSAWLREGQAYQPDAYFDIAQAAWEAGDGP